MFKTKGKASKSKKNQKTVAPSPPPPDKKELLAQKRKTERVRKEAISAIATYSGIGAAISLVMIFIVEPKLAIVLGVGVAVLALSAKYPRQALWIFLIYLPFAGTITYTVGGLNPSPIFQLAKDGFYIPSLIVLILQLQRQRLPILLPAQLRTPIYLLLTTCILTLLFVNINLQFSGAVTDGKPIPMGILGLKVFMGYIPLITCAYHLIRNKTEFLFFTRLHVILAIICCGLGVMQYLMLSMGICKTTDNLSGSDLFRASIEYKCLVGGSLVFSPSQNMIRLPGTFVAPWQWAWFLISNCFFTFASAFGDPSLRWQIVSFVGMALVFVNAVISGQRIALALVPLFTIILLILTGQVTNLKRFLPIFAGLGILILVAMVAFPDVVQGRIESFVDRWNASPPTDFIQHQFEFTSKENRGPFGNGLGRATNSARAFGETKLIETYYPKIFYELGIVGVAAFLLVVTVLTTVTFKTYRKLKDKSLRAYGASFWVFVLFISYNTYYYPLDVDPVAVYYWFFAGVILKLPVIEQQEEEEKRKLAELLGESPPPVPSQSK
ncbi:MAG: hypothetical protein Fur0025_30910 [Oscillatoriaceae cyanobacterium]